MDFYVHVDRGVIDSNRKHGRSDPPVTIRRGKRGRSSKCFEVELPPGSRMLYDPAGILACGAKVAIVCPTEPKVIR